MMNSRGLFLFFIFFNYVHLQTTQDSLYTTEIDSKAPIVISTLPFLNDNPQVAFALTALLLAIENNDTLLNNSLDPNTALFLSSIPLLNLISDNEALYISSFGQIYNKKYFKAFIMSTMKTYWLSEYHGSKNNDIKDRNRSLWWLLILSLYGMADAYVDAHINQNIDINNNIGEDK